ncbi:hypothetical protein [Nocardia thailandica]
MSTSTALYCGTRWDEHGSWSYELARPDGSTEWLPGLGTRLAFRVTGPERYCLGYNSFGGTRPGRQACPQRARVTVGKQCDRCRVREGWSVVHGHRGPLSTLPEQVRDYMAQPHHLYIAYFGRGIAKVGTASAIRRHRRLYEQGALMARFIADSPDGLHVRDLERLVSGETGLRQAVPSATKTRVLTEPLAAWTALEQALTDAADHATTALPTGTTATDTPWSGGASFYATLHARGRYPTATDFTASTGEYVLDAVTAHGHTLACRADSGDGDGELILVDDSRLIGRRIDLDDTITTTPEPAQAGLF